MPNMSINYHAFLIQLFEDLVECVRYSNGYLFELLKNVTVEKSVVISLDEVKIHLYATQNNGYELHLEKGVGPSNFRSNGETLRKIVDGTITLDHALATNDVFVKGSLEDLLGIFRLTIRLLAEAPVDPHLQRLWRKFDKNWMPQSSGKVLAYLEEQQVYNYFPFQNIPDEVALINLNF